MEFICHRLMLIVMTVLLPMVGRVALLKSLGIAIWNSQMSFSPIGMSKHGRRERFTGVGKSSWSGIQITLGIETFTKRNKKVTQNCNTRASEFMDGKISALKGARKGGM